MKHCKLLVAFLLILALFINIGCQKTMTKKALALGAEKIFFTRFEFENFNKQPPPSGGKKLPEIKATIKDGDQKEAYKKITSLD